MDQSAALKAGGVELHTDIFTDWLAGFRLRGGGIVNVEVVNELCDWSTGLGGINGYISVADKTGKEVQAAALTEGSTGGTELGYHWLAGGV